MSGRLISVVIPTRERNATLALCLDRLAPGAQTLPHDQYEVIVSDDSDGHLAFELVRDRYPWARWQEGPRRGPAANRNAGARAARGTWLVFTDDDCLPDPIWLEAYVAAMNPNEAALDVLEGRTTCRAGLLSPRQAAPLNLEGGRLWSCNFAIRRAGFEKVGGFDERYPFAHMEDADLQARLRKSGYMIHVLHMVLHGPRRGLRWYLVNQSRARLSRIVRGRKSIDTLSALASLPVELSSIALNWRAWHRKAQSHTRQRA